MLILNKLWQNICVLRIVLKVSFTSLWTFFFFFWLVSLRVYYASNNHVGNIFRFSSTIVDREEIINKSWLIDTTLRDYRGSSTAGYLVKQLDATIVSEGLPYKIRTHRRQRRVTSINKITRVIINDRIETFVIHWTRTCNYLLYFNDKIIIINRLRRNTILLVFLIESVAWIGVQIKLEKKKTVKKCIPGRLYTISCTVERR